MPGIIRTVAGDMDTEQLGWCQCHEHLFLRRGEPYKVSKALCMEDYDKSLGELKEYYRAEGVSIVDAQPVYAGRMASALRKASQESGVHIIASTGFHKAAFYESSSPVFSMSQKDLTDLFIAELEEGMKEDGRSLPSRAGIIKVAVDRGGCDATPAYSRLFGAAVAASAETGAAIMAHFEPDTDVFQLIDKMDAAGIPPARLIACHLDRARIDAGYHRQVACTGAYLEYDTINRLKYVSNESEIHLIRQMLEYGLEDHLLLSLDTTNERLRTYGSSMGLDYILTVFRPMLEKNGVLDSTVRKMMIANPSKAIAVMK